ncbi:sensor histidine kinase [Pelosinus sp. sgz500959]|uniref:sensor histidine kinase n=1 Tax=Pelosinus sp. sgz500959 TaxID=3242472 RepID=UPI00367080B1
MKYSLQLKLLYSFMLVIVVMLVGVSFGVSLIIKEETVASKQEELIEKGSELAQAVSSFQQEHGSLEELPSFLNSIDGFVESRVWILNQSRQVIAMSTAQKGQGVQISKVNRPSKGMGAGFIRNELDPVFEGKVWTKIFDHPFYEEKMLVVAVPIIAADGSVEGAVLLNRPVTEINSFLYNIYYSIGIAGLVAFLLALLVVSRLTRSIVRPLKAMQETAAAMAKGDYSTSVTVESRDEVGNLGVALNSLAQDLASYIEELNQIEKLRREFVANVSHEFRTPMTIIRGYNEALMDGTVNDSELVKKYHSLMGDEILRLERLITDLLDLSRLQSSTVPMEKEKLPLATLVDSVVNLIRQQAEQKQVSIIVNTQKSNSAIWGNGDRIIQLLLIIVDNALKYTPAGGTITVGIVMENDWVVLTVVDTGIGIPETDLPYIWNRLYKVDKSHCRANGGTGLGLAIGKEIIDLHHAEVKVTSQVQQGTTVTIRFPLADKISE